MDKKKGLIMISVIGIGTRSSAFGKEVEDFINAVDTARRNNMPFVTYSQISQTVHNDIFYESVAWKLKRCAECGVIGCSMYKDREILIKAITDFSIHNFRSSLFVEWLANQFAIIDHYKGKDKEGFDLEKAQARSHDMPEGWIDEDEDEAEK